LDESTTLHYQEFKAAMQFNSSFRNARAYVFAAAKEAPPAQDKKEKEQTPAPTSN